MESGANSSLNSFIDGLTNALKVLSPEEIKESLSRAMFDKNKKFNEYEELVIELVCKKYKISRRSLLHTKFSRTLSRPKEICFCLLHLGLDLSVRQISTIFRYKNHSVVWTAIKKSKNLNLDLKIDREFNDDLMPLLEKLKSEINKQ